MVITSEQK